MLVSAGSISRHATSPSASRRSSASSVVERHHRASSARRRPAGPSPRAGARPCRRRARPGSRRRCRGSTSPSPRSWAGRSAAGRTAARTGWRRSPTSRTASAAARTGGPSSLGHPDRVLRRQHRGDARSARAPRAASATCGQRVPGHRAGVAEAQVDVLDAVDVGEPSARRRCRRRPGTRPASGSSTASVRRPAARPRPARRARPSAGASSTNRRSSVSMSWASRSRSMAGAVTA